MKDDNEIEKEKTKNDFDRVMVRKLFEKTLNQSQIIKVTKNGHLKRRLPFCNSEQL
jgi:hypothetical protein